MSPVSARENSVLVCSSAMLRLRATVAFCDLRARAEQHR